MSRRLRAFKRWMISNEFEWSNGIEFIDKGVEEGISVRAVSDLCEGDVVAKIPKKGCLTIKTCEAREVIEDAELGGSLGLSVAIMYERSLGEGSRWSGYLQLLNEMECVPLVWTLDEVDQFLKGTELHKTVKDDKAIIYEDWKECILPLIVESGPLKLNPKYFGAEQYFAARSLVSSRSFEIDDYHGYGMVPLADLFNHKTGAENVHITNLSSLDSSSDDDSGAQDNDSLDNHYDELSTEDIRTCHNGFVTVLGETNLLKTEVDISANSEEGSNLLEMIIVREAKGGDEVFNTYGSMGNAALLHRYGFTESDNPFDIVNIELSLVLEWSSLMFSNRHSRSRLSIWRRIGYSGCVSQDSEYFEISLDGEPQFELVILVYIIFLPDEVYYKLNQLVSNSGDNYKASEILLSDKNKQRIPLETPEIAKEFLLTDEVCEALVSLADIREASYGTKSLSDDLDTLANCCIENRKLYHSLVLRMGERKLLENLRTYASSKLCRSEKGTVSKKRQR